MERMSGALPGGGRQSAAGTGGPDAAGAREELEAALQGAEIVIADPMYQKLARKRHGSMTCPIKRYPAEAAGAPCGTWLPLEI